MGNATPMDEQNLDSDDLGWVRVSYQHDLVCLDGYGERLCLRVREALKLLRWLQQSEPFLLDRTNNFYDCRECGYMHHRSVVVCPTLRMSE